MPKTGSTHENLDSSSLRDREFEAFRKLIREVTGISLAPAKRELLRGRLSKRMRQLGLSDFAEYLRMVTDRESNPGEMAELVNCITTNKTDFLREPHHFHFLKEVAFPEIVELGTRTGTKNLRVWSAACSTGPEPYTIAMTARDFFNPLPGWDIRILASDVDSNCLKTASLARYPEHMIDCVPIEQKKRYFLRGTGDAAGQVVVKPTLRELVTFRQINFADDSWPVRSQFDVIFCRNALIYFDQEFQEQLIRRFLRHLAPHGYLILGHSENIAWMKELEPIGNTVYRLKSGAARPEPVKPRPEPVATVSRAPAIQNRRQPEPAVKRAPIVKKSPQPAPAPPGVKKRKAIVAGEVYASRDPVIITTLLGSCIAVCLYDPTVQAGGMNHFLLPAANTAEAANACFGINAMELLINELMTIGGDRNRMVAQLFGGGSVMQGHLQSSRVGEQNISFVRKYLNTEGIPILEQKVGGSKAMRISMLATTGQVMAKELGHDDSTKVKKLDAVAAKEANKAARSPDSDQITLF